MRLSERKLVLTILIDWRFIEEISTTYIIRDIMIGVTIELEMFRSEDQNEERYWSGSRM